ncbi:AraC family transcriptional regulator [Terriglobus saanensis]|uniref:Transcriptional regulator, AraC family n=1 Tax=Terriglobus saanensis (strain ATCC BAA-1853 / DSM 23119 / SP1PR4) TaxID=401053 RepID=E8V898_TERSS|nr:helix-turn-helix domain-containing protein [Terriglobus saanensis]ADV81801.1 transcriptional regulator, AraC family [Terriglobus saanensis SP1PR4]
MQTAQPNTNEVFDSILRGPSTLSASSRGLNWNGYVTERHSAEGFERPETILDRYIIGLWDKKPPVCDYADEPGEFLTYRKPPKAMVIAPPGILPAVRPHGRCDMILCALEPEFVNGVEVELDQRPKTKIRYQRDFADSAFARLMEMLSAEANQGGPLGRLYADHLANAMAIRLLHVGSQTKQNKRKKAYVLPLPRLHRVIERMRELQADLDLQTLAAESGYSRSHFLRMFRASTGCTPHRYLMGLRLERAKELMRQKNRSLIDIAATCGFSSHAHLSRMFHQVVGVPPSEYRRFL